MYRRHQKGGKMETIETIIQQEREWNRAALGFGVGFLGGIVFALVWSLI